MKTLGCRVNISTLKIGNEKILFELGVTLTFSGASIMKTTALVVVVVVVVVCIFRKFNQYNLQN